MRAFPERSGLIQSLEAYVPYNEQEVADRAVILALLKRDPEVFLRTDLIGHMTASAWVVNQNYDRILMAYHRIYDSWSWLGGHADGETDLLAVAMREVKEESGILSVHPLSEKIFSVETLTVDGHEKNGRYVPSHLHFNLTYLLWADDAQKLRIKKDENSGVAWFPREKAIAQSSEKWFRERIYSKLIAKMECMGI